MLSEYELSAIALAAARHTCSAMVRLSAGHVEMRSMRQQMVIFSRSRRSCSTRAGWLFSTAA